MRIPLRRLAGDDQLQNIRIRGTSHTITEEMGVNQCLRRTHRVEGMVDIGMAEVC